MIHKGSPVNFICMPEGNLLSTAHSSYDCSVFGARDWVVPHAIDGHRGLRQSVRSGCIGEIWAHDTNPLLVACSRQVKILPDEKYDTLIPGGMGGAVTMVGLTEVQNLVHSYYQRSGIIDTQESFLVNQSRCTHLSRASAQALLCQAGFDYKEQDVVVLDTVPDKAALITGHAPGPVNCILLLTVFPFVFMLIELLCEKCDEVVGPMIIHSEWTPKPNEPLP
ncbi:hypothetical protein F4604DRAFT_1681248 [Suillus subluteus]|nr:hypothetical protein F4604DRAFT_1681248 [Suillus subluteus]